MLNKKNFLQTNLQLFAEGAGAGDGGTGAEGANGVSVSVPGSQSKGEKNPLAGVKYGIQEDAQTADVQKVAEDRNAKFEFE